MFRSKQNRRSDYEMPGVGPPVQEDEVLDGQKVTQSKGRALFVLKYTLVALLIGSGAFLSECGSQGALYEGLGAWTAPRVL